MKNYPDGLAADGRVYGKGWHYRKGEEALTPRQQTVTLVYTGRVGNAKKQNQKQNKTKLDRMLRAINVHDSCV